MAFPMTTPQVPVYGMVSLETLREVILIVGSNVVGRFSGLEKVQ